MNEDFMNTLLRITTEYYLRICLLEWKVSFGVFSFFGGMGTAGAKDRKASLSLPSLSPFPTTLAFHPDFCSRFSGDD